MSSSAAAPAALAATAILSGTALRKTFDRGKKKAVVTALAGVDIAVRPGTLAALVGPDGAGKTTLLRLIAGLLTPDAGSLQVLGLDVVRQPQAVQDRLGYMPQRFGLYEDLTVQENLDLYADLHGVAAEERRERYPRLMDMTQLGPFTDRLAGRLSGGMKQKLGLACTLVRKPDLLLLDEPTVGVDPLSRRELWSIIDHLVREQKLSVLMSTSYLDEAERCEQVVVLHEGRVLTHGHPAAIRAIAAGRTWHVTPAPGQTARSLQARLLHRADVVDAVPEAGCVRLVKQLPDALAADAAPAAAADLLHDLPITLAEPEFEDGFMILLRQAMAAEHPAAAVAAALVADCNAVQPAPAGTGEAVVEVRDLVRRFGRFVAVDHISFSVQAGEIVGLLGPNGAGKTTTFRMLCGLLAATGGRLQVAGVDLHTARASARQRIGYVAQKFSLYGQLSVRENLEFFASAYGLRGARRRDRIDWALNRFELTSHVNRPSGELPGGYKQRLAMAAALLHEPDILFLDEPTSGADPLARREFWLRITALAEAGVTIIVTTHFMGEAEYCDRVVIMDAGRVLAQGTPAEIRRLGKGRRTDGRPATMDNAFIAIVEQSRHAPVATVAPAGSSA